MDITDATKALIPPIQALKLKYPDPASQAFIDFYCQCQQGMDYLMPPSLRKTVRLIDILQWFCQCVELGRPTIWAKLMWQDVAGPTLAEYREDQSIENNLATLFEHSYIASDMANWDRIRQPDGSVDLILRNLLDDIDQIEQAQVDKT